MSLKKYFQDVKSELKRVTWPSFDEVNRAAGAVLGLFLIIGAYVAIIDWIMILLWKVFHLGPYKTFNTNTPSTSTTPLTNTGSGAGTSTP
jgi:preprotein translocase SecE subunit